MSLTLCLLVASGAVAAQVNGVWNTTGMTRILVTQPLFPGARPDGTVKIQAGSYRFDDNGDFTAGGVLGTWSQNRAGAFSIRVDKIALVDQFKSDLEAQGFTVNRIRLNKVKLSGNELVQRIEGAPDQTSLWADEVYDYRVDLTYKNGSNETVNQRLRVAMTVRVAADAPASTNAAAALTAPSQVQSGPTVLELAAQAVARYVGNAEATPP